MPRDIDVILEEKTALLARINNFNELMEKEPDHKEYYEGLIITANAILVKLEKEIASNPNPKVAITITPSKNNSGENKLGSSGGKRQKKRKSKKHMKSKKTTKGKAKKTRRKSTRRRR